MAGKIPSFELNTITKSFIAMKIHANPRQKKLQM